MYNDVITLVKQTYTTDELGDLIESREDRQVFADCRSISASEFYQAQAAGYKPEIKFVLADFLEYQGEQMLKYASYGAEEEEYTVIRTYRNNNELEIVCNKGVD